MQVLDSSRKRKDSAVGIGAPEQQAPGQTRPHAKTPRKWKVWEDVRLIVAARRHGVSQWKHVASEVGNSRNHMQVLQRWKAIIEPAFSEVKWSQTEDAILRSEVSEIMRSENVMTAMDWRQVAARMPFRSGVEVEARWYNYLADSKQKLDYATNTPNRAYEIAALLETEKSRPLFSVAVPNKSDKHEDGVTPIPPPSPQYSSDPREPQHENSHEEQKKDSNAPGNQFTLSSADNFNSMGAPQLSIEAGSYDEFTDIVNLPYSD